VPASSTQAWPPALVVQSTQATPEVPQDVGSVPGEQRLPWSQQPPALHSGPQTSKHRCTASSQEPNAQSKRLLQPQKPPPAVATQPPRSMTVQAKQVLPS
jgi:hypothetical protein